MSKNNYFEDSKYFIKEASRKIKRRIEPNDYIQIVLNISLGIERYMKGILYDINPVYVLKTSDFYNSFPLIYKNRILNKCSEEKIISKKPDEDVITFRQSLSRTQIISKTIYENKSILYKLGYFRDIIAHCKLELIDVEELKIFIYRDFYPIMKDLCLEFKTAKSHFIDEHSSIRIAKISSEYQVEIEKQLQLILEASKEFWELNKIDAEFIEMQKKGTEKLLEEENTYRIKCPSCGNHSILFIDFVLEYIPQYEKEIKTDFIPKYFKCKFCHLRLEQEKLIDDLIIPLLN